MSTAVREAMAAAISTVPGLTGYADEPANKRDGVAWPVLRTLTRDGTMCGPYVRTYEVYAILPAARADSAAEGIIEPLVEALLDLGEWTEPAETVQVAFDNQNTMPAIRVRITPHPDLTI